MPKSSGGGGSGGRSGGGGNAPTESEIVDRFYNRSKENMQGVSGTFSNAQYADKQARDKEFLNWYRSSGADKVQIKNEGDRERIERNVKRWISKGW